LNTILETRRRSVKRNDPVNPVNPVEYISFRVACTVDRSHIHNRQEFCKSIRISEFRQNTGLLADFIGRDAIKLLVPFYWNNFGAICEYGMAGTFSQHAEAAFRQVPDEITPFD
jgi:hypothetical protein